MLAERKKDELRDALQKTAAQAQPQAQAAQAQPQADAAGKGGLFEMP
jgi:hypothetical protein